jgi:hydroxymethylpyrimidine/phosphomethylpyrimidine kinase
VKGRVLIVAGTDPSGGAGIQADIKATTALGGYAMTAITALVAQNTLGVRRVLDVPPDFIAEQIELCATDIGADVVKTGMLHKTAVIEAVAGALDRFCPAVPVVVDPVMVAKSGDPLLEPAAADALKRLIVARAAVITPNIPEAEALTGLRIRSFEEQEAAAEALLALGPKAALVKGGHGEGATVRNLLRWRGGRRVYETPRLDTKHTHGTGCTLASAIAVLLGKGMAPRDAVAAAKAYLTGALQAADRLRVGHGHGPVHHFHALWPQQET